MLPMSVPSCIVLVLFSVAQIKCKTYFFSLNRSSNEYTISTRINPNNRHSEIRLAELRNNVTQKKIADEDYTHPVLDSEWEYNWKNITRPKLPVYIKKYYETSKNITGPIRFLFNTRRNSTIVQFNISDTNVDENVSDIQMHFFHEVDGDLLQKSLIIRLYQMENDFVNRTSLISPDAHKLLNVIYLYQATSGWQVFKLTNTLRTSINSKSDLRLFITISKPNEEQFRMFRDANTDALRTFLIMKSESPNIEFTHDQKLASSSCKKYNFRVDFNRLNWMHFIIAPLEYDAFNCRGTCYRGEESVSNHFRVVKFSPEVARKSLCCVPVKYSPLPIMFYDKKGNVLMKLYQNMVVTACGCR